MDIYLFHPNMDCCQYSWYLEPLAIVFQKDCWSHVQFLLKYPNIDDCQFYRYLEPLAIALEKERWSLVQFLFSSSYSGYGVSSLKQVNLFSFEIMFHGANVVNLESHFPLFVTVILFFYVLLIFGEDFLCAQHLQLLNVYLHVLKTFMVAFLWRMPQSLINWLVI